MQSFNRIFSQLKKWLNLPLNPSVLRTSAVALLLINASSWAQWPNHASTKNIFVSNTVKTEQVSAVLRLYAPTGLLDNSPQARQWLALEIQHAPEWHTYWKNPGDAGLATQLTWTSPEGVKVGETLWPRPERIALGELINYGFTNKVTLLAPLFLQKPLKETSAPTVIQLHASWLVCRQECIPQEGDFNITLPEDRRSSTGNPLAQAVLEAQAKVLTSARALAYAHRQDSPLSIQVQGLPMSSRGHLFDLFPEQGELLKTLTLEQVKAAQRWNKEEWTLDWPVSELRAQSPTQWSLLMIDLDADSKSPTSYRLVVNMTTPWPTAALETPLVDPWAKATSAFQTEQDTAPSSLALASLLIALLSAFAGGLLLNLMPCVLPVLAIKALSFLPKDKEDPHRTRFLAESYALGIWITLLSLGGLILLLRAGGAQLGWGFQLQSPIFVVFLCLLFTLIALNLWGVFEIQQSIPQFLSSMGSKNPLIESFLSGALSVLIASPCTAPFMGASIGLAFTLPAWQGMLLFSMLALGLSFPILLIGWLPKTAELIPKPGPWMLTFRACLGFPMALTVLWLCWVLAQQVGLTAMVLELMLLLNLSAAAWAFSLRHKSHAPEKTVSTKIAFLLLALFILLQTAWIIGVRSSAESTFTSLSERTNTPNTAIETEQASSASQDLPWQTWSAQSVQEKLAQGQPVFVDYTAAWCLSCQFNKLTFQKNNVQTAFKAHKVSLFRADWTRQDPAITRSLNELGRNGVPVYLLLKKGQAPRFLSEFVTEQEILKALEEF